MRPLLGYCPVGGRHMVRPWAGKTPAGLSCRKCHQTWEEIGGKLIATWDRITGAAR